MSRSIHQDYDRYRQPMHISELLAETFKLNPTPPNLTAWVDAQPMPGQMELPFCDEVKSEFVFDINRSWEVPC